MKTKLLLPLIVATAVPSILTAQVPSKISEGAPEVRFIKDGTLKRKLDMSPLQACLKYSNHRDSNWCEDKESPSTWWYRAVAEESTPTDEFGLSVLQVRFRKDGVDNSKGVILGWDGHFLSDCGAVFTMATKNLKSKTVSVRDYRAFTLQDAAYFKKTSVCARKSYSLSGDVGFDNLFSLINGISGQAQGSIVFSNNTRVVNGIFQPFSGLGTTDILYPVFANDSVLLLGTYNYNRQDTPNPGNRNDFPQQLPTTLNILLEGLRKLQLDSSTVARKNFIQKIISNKAEIAGELKNLRNLVYDGNYEIFEVISFYNQLNTLLNSIDLELNLTDKPESLVSIFDLAVRK
ncbi:MAG: hypothetical protein ACXVCD_19065 [Pseudobdellovibrionaceae bacterium]